MPSLPFFKKRFILVVLAGLCISFLMSLGFWQLHRAEEKRNMLALDAKRALQPPLSWTVSGNYPTQYQRIKLQGHYLPDVFLLDNQHMQHQFGFHVLSPLQVQKGDIVFIDRGWIPGDISRRAFPTVTIPRGLVEIQGVVYYPSQGGWALGPMYEKKQAKLTIIEQLDIKLLSQLLQKKSNPFIIRLSKEDPHGFVREWAIVSMPPERHMAYAVQWFAMALVLFIIVIVLGFKKKS